MMHDYDLVACGYSARCASDSAGEFAQAGVRNSNSNLVLTFSSISSENT